MNFYKKLSSQNQFLLIAFGFIVVNIILRSWFITHQSFWLDEASSVRWSSRSFGGVIDWSMHNPNGPVYQLLLKVWISIFGISEFATRFLSVLLSAISLIPLMLLAKEIFNKRVAIYAASFFTISNTFIYFAHEARSYTFVVLFVILSFYYFVRLIKYGGVKNLSFFTVSNLLLLFTHVTPILIFLVQFIVTLFYLRASFKKVLLVYLGQFISVAFIVLWILNNSWFGGNETNWGEVPTLRDMYDLLILYFNIKYVIWAGSILAVIVSVRALINFKEFKEEYKNVLLIGLWAVLPVLLMFLVSIYYNPRFMPRYMFYALPGMYVGLAWLIDKTIKNKIVNILVFSTVFVIMIGSLEMKPNKPEEWKKAVAFHRSLQTDETVTAISASYMSIPFTYYYNKEIFKNVNKTRQLMKEEGIFFIDGLEGIQHVLKTDKNKLILVLSHYMVKDPKRKAINHLFENYTLLSRTNFRDIKIFVFDLKNKLKKEKKLICKDLQIPAKEFHNISKIAIKKYIKPGVPNIGLDCRIKTDENLDGVKLVLDIKGNNTSKFWEAIGLENASNKYELIGNWFIDSEIGQNDSAMIYIWQSKGKHKFTLEECNLLFVANKDFYKDQIVRDSVWYRIVSEKAVENNRSIDEQIDIEADWLINQ